MVFHVLNRGVARMQVFEKAGDYEAFERVLSQTLPETPMRICAYCLMPNHWHMVVWPERDGDMARFMQRLTITHVRRWQSRCRPTGSIASTAPTTRRSWRCCVAACSEDVPTGPRTGNAELPSDLAWNPPTVRPGVPGSREVEIRFHNDE